VSIPYVTDGETELDSALFNPIIDAANGASNAQAGTFNLLDYEAAGDGVTDDTVFIQNAIDDAIAAGGGVVDGGGQRYLVSLRSTVTHSSSKYALAITGDGVTLRNMTVVMTDEYVNGQSVFLIFGHAKSAASLAAADMLAKDVNLDAGVAFTWYAIAAAAQGAESITLSTPAQHSNFAVGDLIYIRTGQTLSTAGEGQPDAEINVVTAKNAGTGELTLAYPLVKPYAQEYFPDSGRDEATTTSVTAHTAVFGVANVNDVFIRDFRAENLHAEISFATYRGALFNTSQVFRPSFENVTADLKDCTFQSSGPHRFLSIDNCTADRQVLIAEDSWIAADRGCSDFAVRNSSFTSWGDYISYIHLNEGVANVSLQNSRFLNGAAASAVGVYAAGGRGYNHAVTGCTFSGTGATLVKAATVTGFVLDKCDLTQPSGGGSLTIESSANAIVGANTYGEGIVSLVRSGTAGMPEVAPRVLSGWCFYSDGQVVLGFLPQYAHILSIQIYVQIAFNGGAPTIKVGLDASRDWLANAVAVGSQGFKAVTSNNTQWVDAAGYELTATVTPDGSTAGRALVTITYINGGVPSGYA
jgi:hypothetical protein